ncbi:hypothetical protein IQ251_12015 [Saccharopolyspora sp. HNM0983]|uniref:LPXTG cell wall anchor domain-containing protein n=1 Tax=Saccharopolyspora montiporae TaxID=2781240 RepID=A0A929BCM4_9PSEU|nr:hypothetical protein [Saccharopolyspora sp. HNM0983]MBE9375168.1 hypothetical protein [Saccharopolyspora sp. HNM0983]
MSRSAVAGLATGLLLLIAPPGWADSADAPAAAPGDRVAAASAPPAGSAPVGIDGFPRAQESQQPADQQGPTDRQRFTFGIAGIVLIGAVLLSRKARKKPVLFMEWKKK